MNYFTKINNQNIEIKEFRGQRVVVFRDIDMVHKQIEGKSKRVFYENKDKFIINVDYFNLENKKLKYCTIDEVRQVILFTISGYIKLIELMCDNSLGKIQKEFMNNYFLVQKEEKKYYKPIDKAIKQHFSIAKAIIQATGIQPELVFSIAISEAEKETGYSYDEYKKILPSAKHDVASFNPTQIGRELGGIKPSKINKMLEELGMQEKKEGIWRITKHGKRYGEEKPYTRNGHTDYRILWHENILKKLENNRVI